MLKKQLLRSLLLLCFSAAAQQAMAQYHFINTTLEYAACDSLFYRLGISSYFSSTSYDSLTVESYFGDGSSSIVGALSGTPRAYVGHDYATSGVYTVESILLYNGVPEDTLIFSDTVNLCTTLHVVSFIDHNTNCVFDAGDEYLPNPYTLEVDSAGIAIDTVTSTSLYYPGGGTGTVYAFRVLTLPAGYVLSCPADSVVYDTVSSGMPGSLYATIGFTCDTSGFDLHVWGWFSPGVTGACSHVYAYEYGCGSVPGASLTINYSTLYDYASNSLGLTPSASGSGFVTFPLGTLAPDSVASFNVFFTVAGTPMAGDTTHTTWTVDPVAGDANPANNVHSETDSVHASYDPNEKSVYPQGNILAGTQLHYAVGFENTGNATAINIHVQDTLSANLDISTFKLVSASAPVTTELSPIAGGKTVVKFDFANINLLDSSNPGSNTGMVLFDINAKAGLSMGTLITNRAGIYFDYNPVVMTNTTTNIIGIPSGITSLSDNTGVEIFPNPASDILQVNLLNGGFNDLTIYNCIGEAVLHQSLTAKNTVRISQLSSGVYYVSLRGSHGIKTVKFIKE